jgi:hypothetical protein
MLAADVSSAAAAEAHFPGKWETVRVVNVKQEAQVAEVCVCVRARACVCVCVCVCVKK